MSRPASKAEAVKWTGDNPDEVTRFAGVGTRAALAADGTLRVKVPTDHGHSYVDVPLGHWILRWPADDHHE